MTLLEMVQSIMSDMDSDYVNDIGQSVESEQIVNIIKDSYYYLINNVIEFPEHKEILTLTALADTSHPTWLLIPDAVRVIDYIRYNKETATATDLRYEDIEYLDPDHFHRLVNNRVESDSNVTAYSDFNAGQLLIQTDKHPDYWTTFDDKYVVMDSYLSSLDSTLVAAKLFCYGSKEPTWTVSNTFVPDLDANVFPLLLNTAKAQAFEELKQVKNETAERRSRNQLYRLHGKKHRIPSRNFQRFPNYGRK